MGPVMYRGEKYNPTWGGYDGGVEASIQGEWRENAFECLQAELNRCKQRADNGDFDGSFLELGSFVWQVRPTGAGVGVVKYKWVLEGHGIKLYIHSNPKGNIAPVRVRFGFECLARTNLFVAVETLRKELSIAGFDWYSETLSRVDMQVLLDVDIYAFLDAMQGKRIVTHCRGKCDLVSDCSTMRIQTVTFRSKNMELCIYDKKAQVKDSDSIYFMTFYRWILRGEMPENLTRVEFRFRREMLRRYGVNTFEDLRASQRAMVQVAGRDWFRILDRDKVRGSENEIANAPIWEKTLKAFDFYFGYIDEEKSKKRSRAELKAFKPEKSAPNVERLLKQAVGCFASVASLSLEKVLDCEQIIQFCTQKLEDFSSVLFDKVTQHQVQNDVVRDFRACSPENSVYNKSFYDCMMELILARVPITIFKYVSEY